nr:retrovirus-related Pol polyprotein from transposon TNT 1-94 [Tanacetum cinerariifolium]
MLTINTHYELIGNLKVYEMVLDNDGIRSKTKKEKVKSLALKAKVNMDQTSDDIDSQEGSDEDIDEEGVETFDLLARNLGKFFRKGNRFGRGNRFGNGANRFGRGRANSFGNKGGESSKQKGACCNYEIEGHFTSECRKLKENKAFVGEIWSDSEDGNEHQNDATCLMEIDSQKVVSKPYSSNYDLKIIDLQKENEELLKFNKDFTKTFEKLLKEKRSLENENSKLSSKINDLEIEYKAYDDGHVIFGSNLKGKVVSGGNITHDSITITNVEHVSGLAFNLISVDQLCDDDCVVSFTKVDCTISKNGPFTCQSSEIVERTHRKLRKISCAMLAEQSIAEKFWCHALDMKTYIFNRVYTRKIINKTPYEILRNRKLSLEYFRVFGCKVLIRNIKVHLTKFDPKSYEGVFLGYSQTSKAYRMLNKKTMRIEESLNVTFDESLPEPKSSPSVEDNRIDEPIVQDLNRSL